MTYDFFLVCTKCYWIAPFGSIPEQYEPHKDTICDICSSVVKAVYLDTEKGSWTYYLEDISRLNNRCGNGWSGTTDEEFARLLLYGDNNDIEFWLNPQEVI